MGFLFALFGNKDGAHPLLQLDVLADFDTGSGQGHAALRWTELDQHATLSPVQLRIILAAYQYARNLVNFKGNAPAVYRRLYLNVGDATQRIFDTRQPYQFAPWAEHHVFGIVFHIWPWEIVPPEAIRKPRRYRATLRELRAQPERPLHLWYEPASGGENVLVPAVTMATLAALSAELAPADRERLAYLVMAVNYHFGTNPGLVRIGGDLTVIHRSYPEAFK